MEDMGSNLYSCQLIKLFVKNKDLTPRTQVSLIPKRKLQQEAIRKRGI